MTELLSAELQRLGDDDYLRVHGDHAFETGGLVFFDARLFGHVDSAGSRNDAALRGVAARDPQLVGILGQRKHLGLDDRPCR